MADDQDTPIATTAMKYKGKDVAISLYAPRRAFVDSDAYSCGFSIIGAGLDYIGKSIGFDSMQAVMLSLTKIGSYLDDNDDIDPSQIEWVGGKLDFPTFPRR